MRRLPMPWVLSSLLVACGAAEEPAEPPAEPPARRTFTEPEGAQSAATRPEEAAPSEPDDGEAEAMRVAEAFVRAQGYTEEPPTVSGDAIVHEGIEGTLQDRRGTLHPRALSATGQGDMWMVTFRYVDPALADRGRALRLVRGSPPQFVHQDLLLSSGD